MKRLSVNDDRTLTISLLTSEATAHASRVQLPVSGLIEGLQTYEPRDRKSGGAWSPIVWRDDSRAKPVTGASVESVCALVYDLDYITDDQLEALHGRLDGLRWVHVIHETYTAGRFRLTIPLATDLLSRAYPGALESARCVLGVKIDESARDLARLFYLPAHPPGQQRRTWAGGAVLLDPSCLVASVGNQPPPLVVDSGFIKSPDNERPIPPGMEEWIVAELKRRGPALEGKGGEPHTYKLGAFLVNDCGLSPRQALEVSREWNSSCEPIWRDADLLEKFEHALSYAKGERGIRRREFEGTPFVREIARAKRELLERVGGSTKAREPAFQSLTSILGLAEVPDRWLVNDLITDGAVAVVSAEPKSAKTWLVLAIAQAVASGRPAFGEFGVALPRDVALFMLEDGQTSVKTRLAALASGSGATLADISDKISLKCRGSLDLKNADSVAEIIASSRMLPRPIALLVVDPLRNAHTGEENDSGDMSAVMEHLRAIRDLLGCTVLLNHHSGKAGADTNSRRSGQKMRGSSAIHGAIDNGIYLSDLKGDGQTTFISRVETEVKGARSAGTFYLRLSIEDDPTTKTALSAKWDLSREQFPQTKNDKRRDQERAEKILRALEANEAEGGAPLSAAKIQKLVGMRKADLPPLLAQLRVEAKVRQEGRGGWRLAEVRVASVPGVPRVPGTTVPKRFPVPPSLEGEPIAGQMAESEPESRRGEGGVFEGVAL